LNSAYIKRLDTWRKPTFKNYARFPN